MSDKFLHREDAPFGEKVWQRIDQTVVEAAKSQLSARRILHTEGPYGLGLKSLPGTDREIAKAGEEGATLVASSDIPVAALQSAFTLSGRDIAAFEETGLPLDLRAAAAAAVSCARQEDILLFRGVKALGLEGLLSAKETQSLKLNPWEEPGTAVNDLIQGVTILDKAGFHGPYALALTPALYNLLFRRYPQGNTTELEHMQAVVTDGIVKAPALSTGGVLIASGRQFASIVLGQDLRTSFVGPTGRDYEFTVSESLTLRLAQPAAVCVLK